MSKKSQSSEILHKVFRELLALEFFKAKKIRLDWTLPKSPQSSKSFGDFLYKALFPFERDWVTCKILCFPKDPFLEQLIDVALSRSKCFHQDLLFGWKQKAKNTVCFFEPVLSIASTDWLLTAFPLILSENIRVLSEHLRKQKKLSLWAKKGKDLSPQHSFSSFLKPQSIALFAPLFSTEELQNQSRLFFEEYVKQMSRQISVALELFWRYAAPHPKAEKMARHLENLWLQTRSLGLEAELTVFSTLIEPEMKRFSRLVSRIG